MAILKTNTVINGDLIVDGQLNTDKVPNPTTTSGQLFAYSTNFSDIRTTSTTYVDMTDRTVTYVKKHRNTKLHVIYDDTYGDNQTGTGSDSHYIILLMDGVQVGKTLFHHTSSESGWRILPRTCEWLLEDIKEGSHVFKLQWKITSTTYVNPALAGWGHSDGNSSNFLLVREIE